MRLRRSILSLAMTIINLQIGFTGTRSLPWGRAGERVIRRTKVLRARGNYFKSSALKK